MTPTADSPKGARLTLTFRLRPDFALIRSEFDPSTMEGPTGPLVLSSEAGAEARGAGSLKWPVGKGQEQFKSMVLALVRLGRLQQKGGLPADAPCLLSGPKRRAGKRAKNPAKIMGTLLSTSAREFVWARKFCGLEANKRPRLARYFRVTGLKRQATVQSVSIEYVAAKPALTVSVCLQTTGQRDCRPATGADLIRIERALLELPDWDRDWAQAQLDSLSPPPAGEEETQSPPDQQRQADEMLLLPLREWLVEECCFVPLRGVRREEKKERGDPQHHRDDQDQRLKLEQIFIDLDTRTEVALPRRPRGEGRRVQDARPRFEDPREGERKTRPLPALEAVATHPRGHVVLHGAPGCGKSTFIRFLVLALAECGLGHRRAWQSRIAVWPEAESTLIPLRIELRHFAVWLKARGVNKAEPCLLWDFARHQLETLRDKNSWPDLLPAVERRVRAGQSIFLLDGLDEVPGAAGKLFVRDCLDAFTRQGLGRACRAIVTCRTRSYEADYKGKTLRLFESPPTSPAATDPRPVPLQTGSAFEFAPFNEDRKRRFVRCWYEALVDLGECVAADAEERIPVLQQAVCDPGNSRLGELAANPLLLTVIAHLHSSRRDLRLPDNRAELFHDLLDLLLTRWAERHRTRVEATPGSGDGDTLADLLADPGVRGFETEHFLQLVARLAHAHYRGGRDEKLVVIPRERLRQALEDEHHDPDTHKGAAWAERVLNFIQFRAGLLNSPDGENFDFPHSLLGEYLAAYHLANERRSSEVVTAKVTSDGNWDEVVRLVAGHHVFVKKLNRDALDLAEDLAKAAEAKRSVPGTIAELEWRRVALAADILHEMGPERWKRERDQGPRCSAQVQALITLLLGQTALPPRDRARAAAILGALGDERPGVGVDEQDGAQALDWIAIPPGPFIMGSKKGEAAFEDETPQFECSLIRRAYRISRYPVTVRQYRAFVEAGGYEDDGSDEATRRLKTWWRTEGLAWKRKEKITGPEDYQSVFQTPNHPRVGVSWYEAIAFCQWLTGRLRATGKLGKEERVTLPTEAQWERAARHTDGRKYPWEGEGEDLAQRCNMEKSGIGHTSAVGLFPNGLAKCGAADMSGNVWEWCRTKRRADYVNYQQLADDDLDGREPRVVRGGSWGLGHPAGLSCSYRYHFRPGSRRDGGGFRCVVMDDGSA